jgi:hypothetical protein
MTPLDARAIEVSAAAAWSGTAVAAAFVAKGNARWGNIITSVVIAGGTIATFIGYELAKARFLEGHDSPNDSRIDANLWVVSPNPDLGIYTFLFTLAVISILLSLRPKARGWRSFWLAWLLNAPAIVLGFGSLLINL